MPPEEQQSPAQGLEPQAANLVFDQFQGINTSTTRVGVDDSQMWWCDGFFPLGPRDLRTLYDVGTSIWTPANGTIEFFDFANIGATPYLIGFTSLGDVWAVNTTTLIANQIAPTGTILNPSRQTVAVAQYGSQYVLIVSQQTNGYWLWDGTTFYGAGGIGPVITISNGGSGYTSAPTVSFSGGSGSGAAATAVVANGIVIKIIVTNPGTGYVTAPTIAFSGGGGSSAAATSVLMPTGISGSGIEIYSGRVWIANGATINFSVAGSVTDFSTGDGGGSFSSSDSFLRVQFSSLVQTNGFLYLIADSSINYISGVQTTGTPPTTTFTNQNADPEVGTVWPGTVDVFGRNIIFANAFGAHVSYGAAVTKISDQLDGVYNSATNFGGKIASSAKAIVFGKKIWILLLDVIDLFTGQEVNKLFIWDSKRWFSSQQSVSLRFIQHQEINSVITAYGTDGANVYPLFAEPSVNFTKTVQSKLWTRPVGIQEVKAVDRVFGLLQYYSLAGSTLNVSVDNENSSNVSTINPSPGQVAWTNSLGATVQWTNSLSQIAQWFIAAGSILVLPPQATGQQGVLAGITIQTQAADMAIVLFSIPAVPVGYRG
jgi:hypothetical protein